MQHGPRLQQHAEALCPAFWAHRGRVDREEEIEIHLLLLGQFGHGELKELEEKFEKIKKRKAQAGARGGHGVSTGTQPTSHQNRGRIYQTVTGEESGCAR